MNKMTHYLLLAVLLPIAGTQAAFFMGFELNTPGEIQKQIKDKKDSITALVKTIEEMDIPEIDKECYRKRLSENENNDLANKFIGNESLLSAKQAELKNLEKLLFNTRVKIGAYSAIPVVLAVCGVGAYVVYKKQKNKNKKKDMVVSKLTKASEIA